MMPSGDKMPAYLFLGHVLELPGMADWFAGQNMNPVESLVKAVYQDVLGRDPTADELQKAVDDINGRHGDWHPYTELADGLAMDLTGTQEWRDRQSRRAA